MNPQESRSKMPSESHLRVRWDDVVDPAAFRQALRRLSATAKRERPSRLQRIKDNLIAVGVIAALLGTQMYFSHKATNQWFSPMVAETWTGAAACVGVLGLAVAGTVIGLTRNKVEHRVLWLGGTLLAGTFARNLPPDEGLALLVPLAMVTVTFVAHLIIEHSTDPSVDRACNHEPESV